MQISPDVIHPSQDFLKAKTIRFIFRCLNSRETDKLPPPPLVRKDQAGNLVAIDGHNLLAVRGLILILWAGAGRSSSRTISGRQFARYFRGQQNAEC